MTENHKYQNAFPVGQGSSKKTALFVDGKKIDYHDLRKLYTMIERQNKYCFINAEEEC